MDTEPDNPTEIKHCNLMKSQMKPSGATEECLKTDLRRYKKFYFHHLFHKALIHMSISNPGKIVSKTLKPL